MFYLTGVEAVIFDTFVDNNWQAYEEMGDSFFIPSLTIWGKHKTANDTVIYEVTIRRYSFYNYDLVEKVATNALTIFHQNFELKEQNDSYVYVSAVDTSISDGENTHNADPIWKMEDDWKTLLKLYRDATALDIKYIDGLTGEKEPID